MGIFNKKKDYECLDCEENFEKRDELLTHGQTIHNRTILKCPICNESFLYPQSRISHQENHTVSLEWQFILLFIPLMGYWAFIRIHRFTKMVIVNLISIGAIFIPGIILSVINSNDTYPFFKDPIHDEIFGILGIGFIFGVMIVPSIFFVIKWSREWNKKIDALVESMSKDESSSKDEIQHD